MSSFTDQTEARDSSHSLLSSRRSELGSRYVIESGVYMSSFAATIFVAALVTIGVLMLTMLVALTVMLNSCQSRNTGTIDHFKTNDDEYGYCHIFAFHAELNNLEVDDLPAFCKQSSLQRHNVGTFFRELNFTVQLAESYFSTLTTSDDHLDAILIDIDDIFLPDIARYSNSAKDWRKHVEHEHPAHMLVLGLFLKLKASGWPLILFTRKHSSYRNDTAERLISAGYDGWSSLIMRSDKEFPMESWEYISVRRLQLIEQGYRIASIISSRMDAFRGSLLGSRNFKLANPTFYSFQVHGSLRVDHPFTCNQHGEADRHDCYPKSLLKQYSNMLVFANPTGGVITSNASFTISNDNFWYVSEPMYGTIHNNGYGIVAMKKGHLQ